LTWDEVDAGKVRPLSPAEVLKRVDKHGDLLESLLG
jgi:hypothetical protein